MGGDEILQLGRLAPAPHDDSDPVRATLAEPGGEWELNPQPLPPGVDASQGSYRPRVDFVRFPDGTQWGPDEDKQSLHFAGIRLGVTATRQYLKMLLRQRGIEAVVEELQR